MRNYTRTTFPFPKMRLIILLLFAVIGFMGCKKDEDSTPKFTNIMFVHAIPDAPGLDVYIDDQIKASNVSFGQGTAYQQVSAGSHKITTTETGTIVKKTEVNQGFSGDARYTIFAINTNAQPNSFVASDTLPNPPAGQAWVRYLNLSPDNASYYVGIDGGSIQFPARPYKGISNYKSYDAGTYTFNVVNPATAAVVANPGAMTFEGGKTYNLILSGSASSNSINLMVFGQQ